MGLFVHVRGDFGLWLMFPWAGLHLMIPVDSRIAIDTFFCRAIRLYHSRGVSTHDEDVAYTNWTSRTRCNLKCPIMSIVRQSSSATVRSVLESSTLFNSLTTNELETLEKSCRLVECIRGEPIWLHGSEADFFGLVAKGFVKMVRTNASGIDLTLEIMGPGQIFGLLGTLEGGGCPLMAYGLVDTIFLRIPKRVFQPIYDQSHSLKDRLVRRGAVRLHQKLDFMARLSTGRADERIAAILFVLAESYGDAVGKQIRLKVPLTRQDLGEMAGTSTETAIRILSKWSKARIVETDHQMITILDVDALESILLSVL